MTNSGEMLAVLVKGDNSVMKVLLRLLKLKFVVICLPTSVFEGARFIELINLFLA